MARRVQRRDFDALADVEGRFVGGGCGDFVAVFAADYRDAVVLQLWGEGVSERGLGGRSKGSVRVRRCRRRGRDDWKSVN